MTVPCFSGRFAMRTDLPSTHPKFVSGWCAFALLILCLPAASLRAAEAIPVDLGSGPLPPEAEAAHQDLIGTQTPVSWLDEAIFTEISPLTIPEVGVALPPDQEG